MDVDSRNTFPSEFMTNDDPDSLFDWLNENTAEKCRILDNFLSERASDRNVSRFICDHAKFLYTGKIRKSCNSFENEDFNRVATELGGSSVYFGGKRSKSEYRQLHSFERATDFMSIFERACNQVDPSIAYSSIFQLFGHAKDDAAHLLRILSRVIRRSEKKSPLITTSLVSILEHMEDWKVDINALYIFLESMSKIRDEDDSHGVVSASLQAFIAKVVATTKGDGAISLANLMCSLQNNPFNWIASMCLTQTTGISGPLDTVPLNEAICAFILLNNSDSTMPKVYTLETNAFMCLKVAHVLVTNSSMEDGTYAMGISMCDAAISSLRGSNLNLGKKIENSTLVPWQPVEFLTILLDRSHQRAEDVSRLLKNLLFTLGCSNRDRILRGVLRLVSTDVGLSLSIGECKEQSIHWLECTHIHTEFLKSTTGIIFDRLLSLKSLQEFPCSLSRLLNWLKFLCLCKYKTQFMACIKRNLIEDLHKKFVSSLEGVMDNQYRLLEMLFEELLQLIDDLGIDQDVQKDDGGL